MLNARRLETCKPTAYLINVASPAVIDQAALAAALRQRLLAGAAMDVHDAHPIPPGSPFVGMPNVLLTPHIGGATVETIERHSQMVSSDLALFLDGKRPKHLANPAVWEHLRKPVVLPKRDAR
jgi:phosphoglycerate dehydrogenase-like enzyme